MKDNGNRVDSAPTVAKTPFSSFSQHLASKAELDVPPIPVTSKHTDPDSIESCIDRV